MARTFYGTTTAEPVAAIPGLSETGTSETQPASSDIILSIAASTNTTNGFLFTSPTDAHTSADWVTASAGTYTASFEVVTLGSTLTVNPRVRRWSSDTATSRFTSAGAGNTAGTGIKTTTVGSAENVNGDAARAASDRAGMALGVVNSSTMTAATATVRVGANTFVTGPWTAPAVGGGTPLPARVLVSNPATTRASYW